MAIEPYNGKTMNRIEKTMLPIEDAASQGFSNRRWSSDFLEKIWKANKFTLTAKTKPKYSSIKCLTVFFEQLKRY